jgi:hypothetical protein
LFCFISQLTVIRYFLVIYQVLHEVREVQLIKVNALQFCYRDPPAVRTAGTTEPNMQLSVTALLLDYLSQF